MIEFGVLKDRIADIIDDDSPETAVTILRHTNVAYREVAALRGWTTLTKKVTNPGSILPGDLVRPIYVEDDTDYFYFESSVQERYRSPRLYNWFRNLTVTTPLLTGTDLATTRNTTTVTSVTGGFTAAMVGEYIRIGEMCGTYKISARTDTNTLVLANSFKAADWADPSSVGNLSSQYFEVRPEGTLQWAQHDEMGDSITTTTISLWYLSEPLPVLNDYDKLLLPGNCEAVRIKVCQLLDQSLRYTNDALKKQGDYDEAIRQMRALDPIPERFKSPRNAYGGRIVFGRQKSGRANVTYRHDGIQIG
jgi:hypothetical protein